MTRVLADVAVIGSGFAGSLAAMALRQRGLRVALVERGRHPRFAIGESTTPLANLLIEELAERYDLPALRSLSKWGTWRRDHADIPVGLKRGFTFLFHRPGTRFADDDERTHQLMVAASPNDAVADTHWYRADFDAWLVNEAVRLGVTYLDDVTLDVPREAPNGLELTGRRSGRPLMVSADFVIDASGTRGCLANAFASAPRARRWMPPTQALYTHFADVGRWKDVCPPDSPPPYPQDDAALHHVFPGGWIWVLRFNNGITSAGAAMTDAVADELGAAAGADGWRHLLDRLPSVAEQFRDSRPIRPFVFAPHLSFRTTTITGRHWALLPSAAGFIDPLLSSGFPLTLLGIERLVDLLTATGPGAERQRRLDAYAAMTQDELDVTEQLVAALYACMDDPELFKRLSLLYFAAASYSETARRLARPDLAPGFLLSRHPTFGPALRTSAAEAAARPRRQARRALLDRIDRAIEPFDAAGLGDHARRGWYPVLAEDLRANAAKFEASVADVERLLVRCGLAG